MKTCILAVLFCFVLGTEVRATTFVVSDVTFTHGSVASGTFDFDGGSVFSNINISLTAGTTPVFGPDIFLFQRNPGSYGPGIVIFSNQNGDQTGAHFIALGFNPDLNSGAPSIPGGSARAIGDCNNPTCGSGDVAIFGTNDPSSVTPVPEPATSFLLGTAAVGLALSRLCKRSRSS